MCKTHITLAFPTIVHVCFFQHNSFVSGSGRLNHLWWSLSCLTRGHDALTFVHMHRTAAVHTCCTAAIHTCCTAAVHTCCTAVVHTRCTAVVHAVALPTSSSACAHAPFAMHKSCPPTKTHRWGLFLLSSRFPTAFVTRGRGRGSAHSLTCNTSTSVISIMTVLVIRSLCCKMWVRLISCVCLLWMWLGNSCVGVDTIV